MPCITDSTSLVEHPPLIAVAVPPASGLDPQTDPRCGDPEFSWDNPSLCPTSSPLSSLAIVPDSGSIQVTGSYGFRAIATFANGLEKDVTDAAIWKTGDSTIGSLFSAGLIKGIGVGSTTVTATWRGMLGSATLDVTSQCVMLGVDVALVFSRSASMTECNLANQDMCPGSDRLPTEKPLANVTRLQKAVSAAKAMVANLLPTDQVAVISFGGIIHFNGDGTATKLPDTTLELPLNVDRGTTFGVMDLIHSNEPCVTDNDSTLNCATGIGGGLDLGMQELLSSRARSGAVQKVIVLLTDGIEQICNPDPVTVAAAAKAAGILIIVVALDVPDEQFWDCALVSQASSHNFLVDLSSDGLAYFEDAPGLSDVFSRIPNIICAGGYGYAGYHYNQPSDHHYQDALNYTGFINWYVLYCVDLIGRDLWVFPALAGKGAYVDLAGTCDRTGGLASKVAYDFPPGNYRLTVELAGNQRVSHAAYGGDRVHVLISTGTNPSEHAVNDTVTILDHTQLFQPYVWNFTIAGALAQPSGIIEIRQLDIIDPIDGTLFSTNVGALLNSVKLENLDSGVVMLYDNFDTENIV